MKSLCLLTDTREQDEVVFVEAQQWWFHETCHRINKFGIYVVAAIFGQI